MRLGLAALLLIVPGFCGAWPWPWSTQPPVVPYKSVFGWEGNQHPAIAYEDGSFFVHDGLNKVVGFSISKRAKSLRWLNHSGYLPCLVTELERGGLGVKVMDFADKVTVGGRDYVVAYARVELTNEKDKPVWPRVGASRRLVVLSSAEYVDAGRTVDDDYAIELDRFGNDSSRLTAAQLRALGGWDEHFARMKKYWDARLSGIAQLTTPRSDLDDSYKAGFIYTQIIGDGAQGGQTQEMRMVLSAIASESLDGTLTVGRGIPDEWLESGKPTSLRNLPISAGRRIGIKIFKADDGSYELDLSGDALTGPVIFDLPLFSRKKIVLATAGSVPDSGDRVIVPPDIRTVQVSAR